MLRKKSLLQLVLVLILALIITSCWLLWKTQLSGKPSPSMETDGSISETPDSIPVDESNISTPETYINQEYGFSVDYPKSWKPSWVGTANVVAKFSPYSESSELTLSHILIQVESGSYTSTLNQVVAQKTNDINNLPDSKIISSQPVTMGVNNLEAHQIVFQAPIGMARSKSILTFTVRDGKAYVISYNSTPTEYDKLLSVNQNMIGSFSFINN